jgi:hypothetical protein
MNKADLDSVIHGLSERKTFHERSLQRWGFRWKQFLKSIRAISQADQGEWLIAVERKSRKDFILLIWEDMALVPAQDYLFEIESFEDLEEVMEEIEDRKHILQDAEDDYFDPEVPVEDRYENEEN